LEIVLMQFFQQIRALIIYHPSLKVSILMLLKHLPSDCATVTLVYKKQWLRDVTAGELAERFSAEGEAIIEGSSQMPAEVVSEQYRRFASLSPDDCPLAHPYYWAAFTFSGA
jgi:CHAT domain-containing protein